MKLEKFEKAKERSRELERLLADPQIIADQAQYQKLAREYAEITPIVTAFAEYKKTAEQMEELEKLLQEKHDAEFEALAQSELKDIRDKHQGIIEKLTDLINPKAPEHNRDLIIEIRAGTGGQEAGLFAADLCRMYTKYAEAKGWKVELMSSSPSEKGGLKEVILGVSGKGAERSLKWESGAHRVQRVPQTEASGRIHTSAATVFRSSGPGGQSVNTTDSAVRLTHLPTGIVVTCQDERSQLKNRAKAMRVLRARLLDKMRQEEFEKTSQDRKAKVGSGDRSEKIRTYNFPDRRVTDHRVGFTTYQLANVMDGELDEITQALIKAESEGVLP